MPNVSSSGIDADLLKQIVTATASADPAGFVYVSQTQGQPMLANNPPLIVVNTDLIDPNDPTKCAARATEAAVPYLAAKATGAEAGSTVSAQNDKYSEPTGEMKTVTRAVRDPATKKAKVGADGKKETETVQLPVKKYLRKFTIRPVEGGKNYGAWQAPADGALIARII